VIKEAVFDKTINVGNEMFYMDLNHRTLYFVVAKRYFRPQIYRIQKSAVQG